MNNLYLIIQEQIKKEIAKYLGKTVETSPFTAFNPPENDTTRMNARTELELIPALISLFNKRLASGCEPVKQGTNTVYIGSGYAIFDEDDHFPVSPTSITINSYSEDRWVFIYLKPDGTFTQNKYAPIIGDNKDYIPICKVWKEHDSSDFDNKTLRDLRPVGFAPFSLWHVLRQQFLNLYLGIPKVFLNNIVIEPVNQPSLDIKIGSNNNSILYARLNPIPDTIITIPLPESGVDSQDYYIIASAMVDNYDPNDFTWNFKTKKVEDNLELYEIPLALVKGITETTSEITSDMIETLGYQNKKEDFYNYDLTFSYNRSEIIEVSNDYNILKGDYLILVDASSGNVNINLPSADNKGEEHIIKVKDISSGNSVYVNADGSTETIDGALTKVLENKYECIRIISDGNGNWYIC